MDRLELESELRRAGYRVVNCSVTPNLVAPNHSHDFDAKAFVLGGEITITGDNNALARSSLARRARTRPTTSATSPASASSRSL
jgi:hypothetical protein